MDRPKDSQTVAKPAAPAAPAVKKQDAASAPAEIEHNLISLYLVLYNWISSVLWASVLGKVVVALYTKNYTEVYDSVGWLAKWTQTLAALEMLHSAFQLVRAPFFTTVTQVSSRFFLVWIIVDRFPYLARGSPAYSSMLLAWAVTEVIRYSYFTGLTAFGEVPDFHKWLRYNSFIVLYPLGIASEVWMVLLAREPARRLEPGFEYALWAVLAAYVPGSYMLFTHMLAQRKKVMRGASQVKKTQ